MVECAADRGRGQALSHTARPLPDRRREARRSSRSEAMRGLALLLVVLGALFGHSARSDEIRPGQVELRQTAPDTYSLLFKIPALGDDLRLAIYVTLPEGTSDVGPPPGRFNGGAYTERRTIRRGGGLTGQIIAIKGLSGTSTDVLVRIESLGGATRPN